MLRVDFYFLLEEERFFFLDSFKKNGVNEMIQQTMNVKKGVEKRWLFSKLANKVFSSILVFILIFENNSIFI